MQDNADSALLEVKDLKVYFGSKANPVRAVDGVSFTIEKGQAVALVGESGCGKSVTALSLARLVAEPPGWYEGGSIHFDDKSMLELSAKALSRIRGKEISYIFQEPSVSLNPVLRVGSQIAEAVKRNKVGLFAVRKEVIKGMKHVGIPDPEKRYRSYPHQLSGGQQQRIMMAMALACQPQLLIADEPTTALDVTIQAQVLDLLASLQKESNMAVLMITHNLGLLPGRVDRVYVMYAGQIVESGPVKLILQKPVHPYTFALLQAVPRLKGTKDKLTGIPGMVPSAMHWPDGCRFHPRCPHATDICRTTPPPTETTHAADTQVTCHHWKTIHG